MKKFYLLMLASVFAFAGCSNDDEKGGGDVPPPVEFKGPFALSVSNLRAANFTLDVKVNPKETVGNYYIGVVSAAVAESEYNSDQAAIVKAFIDMEKENETDFSVADGQWIFNGDASAEMFNSWGLTENTKYLVYVFGVSATGEVNTEVVETSATLPAAAMTSAKITTAVTDISDSGAVVSLEIDDAHLPYFCDCIVASEIEGMTDAQIVAYVEEGYGIYMAYASALGNFSYDGTGYLDPDTDYCAVAFGYANDAEGKVIATSAVSKGLFTTLPSGSGSGDTGVPTSVTIPNVDLGAIALSNATNTTLDVSVTPIDKNMTYICFCVDKEYYSGFETPEELILDDLNFIADMASEFGETYLESLGYYLGMGDDNDTVDELKPGVMYVAYAYGMSNDGKTVLSKVVSTELKTTGTAAASVKSKTHANARRFSSVASFDRVRMIKVHAAAAGASARVKAAGSASRHMLR